MASTYHNFLIYIVLIQWTLCICDALDTNEFLDELLKNYSSELKPRRNLSEPVEVKLALHIKSLREINERFQTMSFLAWFELSWRDDFLILKDGIESLTLPLKKVWTPDVSLINSVDDPQHITDGKHLVLFKEGRIVWYPARQYTVRCTIDIRLYPFDKHICEIKIGAWQTPAWTQVFVTDKEPLDTKNFAENGEWILSKTSVERNLFAQYNISWIRFVLHLERRPLYNIMSSVFPILLLSFLNTLVFRLPAESGEKITFCISILLSFTVFLTMFNETMPKMSTNISYLSIYICVHLTMSVFGILTSVEIWRYKIYLERKTDSKVQWKIKTTSRRYSVSDGQNAQNGIAFIVEQNNTDFSDSFVSKRQQDPPDLNANRLKFDTLPRENCDTSYIERLDRIMFCVSISVTTITTVILLILLLKDY